MACLFASLLNTQHSAESSSIHVNNARMLQSISAPDLSVHHNSVSSSKNIDDKAESQHTARISSSNIKPWHMKRPVIAGNPKLKRRELRLLNRRFTQAEVAEHRYMDDIWIAVDGKVYDITEHLVNHHGWDTAGVTTPLSILAHGGMECSKEFHDIHRSYPIAYKQLAAYYIGELETEDGVQPS